MEALKLTQGCEEVISLCRFANQWLKNIVEIMKKLLMCVVLSFVQVIVLNKFNNHLFQGVLEVIAL